MGSGRPEVDPQALGDGEDELAVGHLGADVLSHPTRLLQRPLLVAGGAETPDPAGVRHEKLLPALGAPHPGKAVLEVAAFQELADDCADDGSPKAIARLIALWIDRLELRVEPLDQLIEGSLLGLPGMIHAAGHLGPTAHGRPPWAGRLLPKRLSGKEIKQQYPGRRRAAVAPQLLSEPSRDS